MNMLIRISMPLDHDGNIMLVSAFAVHPKQLILQNWYNMPPVTNNCHGICQGPFPNSCYKRSYWFYVKVDMAKVPNYIGPACPFYLLITPVADVSTAMFNRRVCSFRSAKNGFYLPVLFLEVVMLLKNMSLRAFGPCHTIGTLRK
jgi:hypothetical protein